MGMGLGGLAVELGWVADDEMGRYWDFGRWRCVGRVKD